MLLGEELFSFYVLIISLDFLQKTATNDHCHLAQRLVYVIFHILSYWNGSSLLTLIHVLEFFSMQQAFDRILSMFRGSSILCLILITLGAISYFCPCFDKVSPKSCMVF